MPNLLTFLIAEWLLMFGLSLPEVLVIALILRFGLALTKWTWRGLQELRLDALALNDSLFPKP